MHYNFLAELAALIPEIATNPSAQIFVLAVFSIYSIYRVAMKALTQKSGKGDR